MRELVYLSERKLRHFIPDRKRGWRRPTLRGEVGIPGVGQVGAEATPADSHLDNVIAHLEATARWYEDDVEPGQWVHFEARLAYRVYEAETLTVVLFGQPQGQYDRRLLLHGSPRHLEIGRGLEHLTLDALLSGRTAAWMSGYARVTVATGPSLLVASPLYVAYAPPLDQ